MITSIKTAAENVGINLVFLNSTERVETQLNRVTRDEDNPVMLVSWDIDTSLSFDANGVLENPSSNVVALLVVKPETMEDEEAFKSTEEMAALFQRFLQNLFGLLNPFVKIGGSSPITNAGFKLAPRHGAGKHAGVLGRWTQRTPNTSCGV